MTKIDIISGFLGAGKTTLIKKLINETLHKEKLVLIENEFGEIGIDGGFLEDAGIEIREMNSGCICCSLVGDFSEALQKVLIEYAPERIIIEPSGVGKLSDVIRAVNDIQDEHIVLNSFTTVADAQKCKMYMKNFGEFFNNQIEFANTIILSRTQNLSDEKLDAVVHDIKQHNEHATLITTLWDKLDAQDILSAMEEADKLEKELMEDTEICPTCGHHHEDGEHHHSHEHHHEDSEHCTCEHEHHHEHDEHEECTHEHHHGDSEHCTCEQEHHHEHDEHEECKHEHHHEDGEHCTCKHEHHHDHHHHHADDVFMSWGYETPRKYEQTELDNILKTLSSTTTYGTILRAKGMLESSQGDWMYFDLVPEEYEIRAGKPTYTGRFCVIGAQLNEDALKELFQVA